MANDRIEGTICRDLYVFENENNFRSSKAHNVLPTTILDQVYDDQSPSRKTLRQILEDLKQEIITGGRGNIVFPVTSVNGMTDDIILTKKNIGLGNVDNTSDNDKPLSPYQRNAVMDILKNYDFKLNLNDLYSHIMNAENPHDVTINQINKDDALATFVKNYIGLHNTSQHNTVHADIRGSLRRLWKLVDGMNENVEDKIKKVLTVVNDHLDDSNAHLNVFNSKENISDKVKEFTSTKNSDHTKYPSTRAVVEYVAQKLVEFNNTLPDVKYWIEDIKVVDRVDQLPTPSINNFHHAYVIRYGNTSYTEIALCRKNSDGVTYSWDISYLPIFGKYDQNYFTDSTNGLTIKMDKVVDAILDEGGALETSISKLLQSYYTSEQIDEFDFINKIKMLPGTVDGTIRFYVNDDIMTMSDDIAVAGLKRLAYLEWVTEDEIYENAVQERHIATNSIAHKHIQNRAVRPSNIECVHGYIIGNDIDNVKPTANCISFEKLADYLRPLIGGWPDPNIPGGNPWYDRLSTQLLQTHNWLPGVEYSFGNGGYAIRFKGMVSCIPNMNHKLLLSENLTTYTGFQIMDAGGSWEYQSDPDREWGILGGSNITGHTFATVTMDKHGVYFESISTGNRVNAPFDIWIKYVKTEELDKYPALPPNEN